MKGKMFSIENDGFSADAVFENQHWNELIQKLETLREDVPIATFLQQHFSGKQYGDFSKGIIKFVEGYDAADAQQASAITLREEWKTSDDEKQFRIPSGYDLMLAHLHNKFTRQGGVTFLSSEVKLIRWNRDYVKAELQEGSTIEGEKIIITVPIGLLQHEKIKFDPPIRSHVEASKNIGYGAVIKFLYEFTEPIWNESTGRTLPNFRFIFSDADIPTWWSQLPDETPLITGWLSGPRALETMLNNEQLHEMALKSLAYIFKTGNSEVSRYIKVSHIANWATNPFALGAYGYATTKTKHARQVMAEPVEDTIYFAGEALDEGPAMGTVEAALASGKAVAKKI
jgi:monoamine oxidase